MAARICLQACARPEMLYLSKHDCELLAQYRASEAPKQCCMQNASNALHIAHMYETCCCWTTSHCSEVLGGISWMSMCVPP